ncbi:MAG: hypothetical protein GF388_06170 [Candidatus Aegiribacteria sp.]|nr:hypothetical protein [Candidatus Aegiribacteria sp.]
MKIGYQGTFILFLLVLYAIALYRGYAAGREQHSLITQMKTFGGYVFYFPFLWFLRKKKNQSMIWKALLILACIGALVYILKGYFLKGEEVYIRETTGVRVATRQPNAYAMILLMYVGRIWKNWKNRPPLILLIVPVVIIGSSILLSQTRGIWGGVLLALAAAWILNLFRKKDSVKLGRKLVTSLTALAVLVILVVFAISASGILSVSNIAKRTGPEGGSYITETSTLARLVAWSAVLDELRGPAMITGKGFGALYTCFRPDHGMVITVYYVDSAYFQIALNMGVIGVVVLLGIFISGLIRSAGIFLRTSSNVRAGIALGMFCAIIMLLFAGGFAAVLTNYRFTVLWALLLAMVQTEYIRERNESSSVA